MVRKLKEFWENKTPYNIVEKLSKIETSICRSIDADTFNVISFDNVKIKFLNDLKLKDNKLRSVDMLIFDNKAICLIEMFHGDVVKKNSGGYKSYIIRGIKETKSKVVDSLYIIHGVFGKCGFNKHELNLLFDNKRVKIIPYLLVDIPSKFLQPIKIKDILRKNENGELISRRIETPIRIINCEMFLGLFNKN